MFGSKKEKAPKKIRCSCGYVYEEYTNQYSYHLIHGIHNKGLPKPILEKPKAKDLIFKDIDYGYRHCSVCGNTFSTVEKYREHHYKGKCGGYL